MPKIEIEEADLQRYGVMADFVQKGLADPKARKLLKQAERHLYPERAVPEEDAKAEVMERYEALEKRFDDYRAEQDTKLKEREEAESRAALARRWQGGQGAARKSGYTDEGLTQLESFMEENGIFDHEIGMAYFEKKNPRPDPAPIGSGTGWNFFEKAPDGSPAKDAMDVLISGRPGADTEFLNTMIPMALREARGQ